VVSADAEIDAREIPKAVDGQSRSRKQGESEGELNNQETTPQKVAAGDERPSSLSSSLESHASTPRRRAAKQHARQHGGNQGEKQNGEIEPQVGSLGNILAGIRRAGPAGCVTDADGKGAAAGGQQQAFG